jgi:hypothetical protein
MSVIDIISLGITGLSLVLSPLVYIWRTTVHRIEKLESQHSTKIDETKVRQLLDDKIDPVKEDLIQIRDRLDSIIDKLLDS